MKVLPTPAQKIWFQMIVEEGCILFGGLATIHHCHGGSIVDELGWEWQPGGAQRQNHWLVLPLGPEFHFGRWGVDTGMGPIKGVRAWEEKFGTQVALLELLCRRHQRNVFKLAGIDRPVVGVDA